MTNSFTILLVIYLRVTHPFLKTAMLCQSVRCDHSLSPGPGFCVGHIVFVAKLHKNQQLQNC
jgi:hypothetical protein